jgi:hypothetical protein
MFSVVLVSAVAAPVAAAGEPGSRVRSTDAAILNLLWEGRERSATFRALVDAIDRSNGIVYVEFGFCAFGHLDGCLLPFMTFTHGDRYVRIIVTPEQSRVSHDQLLALIGHELSHAVEVLEHPEVVDLTTMEAMYRKIGSPIGGGQRGYETSTARAAGATILSELTRTIRPQRKDSVFLAATARIAAQAEVCGPQQSATERDRGPASFGSNNQTALPPSSEAHLRRHAYVVESSEEAGRVIASAMSKLPPELRSAFPSVVVVASPDDKRFQKSDPQTQAFVLPDDDDHVYVTRRGGAFREAAKGRSLELAGALAHEAWHLQNGPSEAGAYDHQLQVLQAMNASASLINMIRRAKENAVYTQEFEGVKKKTVSVEPTMTPRAPPRYSLSRSTTSPRFPKRHSMQPK